MYALSGCVFGFQLCVAVMRWSVAIISVFTARCGVTAGDTALTALTSGTAGKRLSPTKMCLVTT